MRVVSVFIDTNVLLYSYDARDEAKRDAARQWIISLTDARAPVLNLQVLNELTHVLLRRNWLGSPERVFETVNGLSEFGATTIETRTVLAARHIHLATRYSWWDCLLLASAIDLGCTYFLSEDLQDGQRIAAPGARGLTIIDPFAHSPDQILVS